MSGSIPPEIRKKLLPLKEIVAGAFTTENWNEIGILTGTLDLIRNHPRLYRSLSFGDTDYPGHVLNVLLAIMEQDIENFGIIERYVEQKFAAPAEVISSSDSQRRIAFVPNVFSVPTDDVDHNLVAVMMPFEMRFDGVFKAIERAAQGTGMRCLRADNLWENAVIVQDIFSLIFRSGMVVCDFTTRNPNVFYEAGIAHTLGKHVVPITQSEADIPFDIRHHRYIRYLDNEQGLAALEENLQTRLSYLRRTQT